MTIISFAPRCRSRTALWLSAALIAGTSAVAVADAPARFETLKTPGGVTFLYREVLTTPFVAINFGMRDTWGLSTPGKEGFSALGSALVMQGAEGGSQSELVERLKDLAASASLNFAAFTTQGNVRAPTATIAQSTMIVASALKHAQPSEKLLARLRQRASGAEDQASLRAETMAERAALLFALGDHPITRNYDRGRFDRVGADDLANWRHAALDKSRLRIAASGRVSRDEAARIVDEAFADLPIRGPAAAVSWPELMIGKGTLVVESNTPQSAVLMIGLTSIGPGREIETMQPAMAVLSGSNGRLWQGVRGSLGSTYGASASTIVVGPGKRLLLLRASVANDQVKDSALALKNVYAQWRNEGITQAELTSAKSRILNDFRAAMDEPSRANASAIALQLANRPVEDLYTYEARVGALDSATVNRFITEKLPAPEDLITVIVTPNAEGLSAMCKIRQAAEASRCPRS